MRLTYNDENFKEYCSITTVPQLIQKLGQYEDIDESPEHLAKIKKSLEIIKEDFFTFIVFKEEKHESKTGETITYYFIDFNRGDYRVYLPKEKWDLLKEILA